MVSLASRPLGRAPLDGDQVQRVPLYAPDVPLDAAQRLQDLALYLLEGMPAALERDVPGAKLVIRVAQQP